MSQKKNSSLRILPIFIFCAVLMLSVKINHVYDGVKDQTREIITISQTEAFAEEKMAKETAEVGKVLEGSEQSSVEGNTIATSKPKPTSFSQSEILILQELAERREYLDLRSKEIDRKAVQLKVAEEEIDKKLNQLQEYETKLKNLIEKYNTGEAEKINSLVKLYSNMKPKDAARIFNTLDTDIVVSLLKEMKPSASSAILSQMSSVRAKEVTDELIGNNFINQNEKKS